MRPVTKPKLTKRQRKAENGPNAAAMRSLAQGREMLKGYSGRPPVFVNQGNKLTPRWAKQPGTGLPWVRTTIKPRYVQR